MRDFVSSEMDCSRTFTLYWEAAMKTLKILLGSGAMIALLGFLNVAPADIRNDSIQPLRFDVDAGDGSVSMPQITFDSGGGATEEAQQTCAMTPGGNIPGLLSEQQFVTPPNPEHMTHPPEVTLAPISALQTPPPYDPRRGYPPTDPTTPEVPVDPEEPPPPPVVPEPTTLLLVGLGIAGAAAARRRWGRA
jgi:hypothetical protein